VQLQEKSNSLGRNVRAQLLHAAEQEFDTLEQRCAGYKPHGEVRNTHRRDRNTNKGDGFTSKNSKLVDSRHNQYSRRFGAAKTSLSLHFKLPQKAYAANYCALILLYGRIFSFCCTLLWDIAERGLTCCDHGDVAVCFVQTPGPSVLLALQIVACS
jgi:hypothetical protein